MEQVLVQIGAYELTLFELLNFIIASAVSILIYRVVRYKYSPKLFSRSDLGPRAKKRFNTILFVLLVSALTLFAIIFLKLNYVFHETEDSSQILSIKTLSIAFFIIQLARLGDWILSNLFIHNYFIKRDRSEEDPKKSKREIESSAFSLVQYIVYAIATIFLLKNFHLDFDLYPRTINGEQVDFKISNFILVILTFLIARLTIWLSTQILLYRFYKDKDVNVGGQFAINQLLKYVIYIIAFIISLQNLGINMTLILGGAAALLVGIGLGLQQTFNDFFSGLVLLFERSVAVGDILEVDGHVGVVKRIGLRSSLVETLDNITVVVPNSHLVSQSVTNWTHYDSKVRFKINISVAYGTDADFVRKILLEVADNNPYILDKPSPFVRFTAFGESSLDFILFFFSKNYLVIEDINSDLRFAINKAFAENNISIPFPHRHVIVHKADES